MASSTLYSRVSAWRLSVARGCAFANRSGRGLLVHDVAELCGRRLHRCQSWSPDVCTVLGYLGLGACGLCFWEFVPVPNYCVGAAGRDVITAVALVVVL